MMEEAQLVTQMLRAAEDWGRQRYGTKMSALSNSVLDYLDDGSVTTTVELYTSQSPTETQEEIEPVQCTVVLEPNGTITCQEI
ncbi:MAG: hypothetical protein M3380_08815 [Chloroflexota bacterium]|nr:hypothetical protein [Chloroflexota bacterium]